MTVGRRRGGRNKSYCRGVREGTEKRKKVLLCYAEPREERLGEGKERVHKEGKEEKEKKEEEEEEKRREKGDVEGQSK